MSEKLTGRRRYRLGLFKKLVLQVEYDTDHGKGMWRDAGVEDLMIIQASHHPFPIHVEIGNGQRAE